MNVPFFLFSQKPSLQMSNPKETYYLSLVFKNAQCKINVSVKCAHVGCILINI